MTDSDANMLDALAPVFLELGRAVYICQTFEDSLCFLLSQMAHETADGEDGAFQAAWDFHSSKPLGQLLITLRKQIEVPTELDEYLSTGIKKRNEIVHGYLTKNAMRLYDPKGRLEVEKELSELKIEVKRRDIAVNKLIDALLKTYGLSNTSLKRNADDLWNFQNPKDPSSAH
ncbi:hypothetical protein GALL_478810 [mine drainage metagenome]|uniref:RiboL-PSP-HEPN domain-containing protein n=1 Tax=mine drainage metagenome TaxID=410659 RepID=A0A1J5PRX9_9ZZZZ